MPQFMANRSVMTKFRKMHKVNYRQEDEIVNSPHSCTSLECSIYRTSKDGEIDLMRQKRDTGIQYRHEKKRRCQGIHPKTDRMTQVRNSISASRYVTTKSTLQIFVYSNTITTLERFRSENT